VAYLVKPLDIRQIVPAVEAAFANASGHKHGASVPPSHEPMAQPVAMAVGVLMHRYSLSRHAALERLERLAASESRPIVEQAERLLEAVELLSMPASG